MPGQAGTCERRVGAALTLARLVLEVAPTPPLGLQPTRPASHRLTSLHRQLMNFLSSVTVWLPVL